MKHYLLAALLLAGLGGCSSEETGPQTVTAAFSQDFSLRYRQSANLPTTVSPELTVAVSELAYSICPKNVNCVAPDYADPTLTITAANGQQQQLKLPVEGIRPYSPAWIDTASVRANGRRYVVYYRSWAADRSKDTPGRADITINLRVEKP